MIVSEVKKWLRTLHDDSTLCIDDGGLTIVEIDANGNETGAYLELGGVPGSIYGDDE